MTARLSAMTAVLVATLLLVGVGLVAPVAVAADEAPSPPPADDSSLPFQTIPENPTFFDVLDTVFAITLKLLEDPPLPACSSAITNLFDIREGAELQLAEAALRRATADAVEWSVALDHPDRHEHYRNLTTAQYAELVFLMQNESKATIEAKTADVRKITAAADEASIGIPDICYTEARSHSPAYGRLLAREMHGEPGAGFEDGEETSSDDSPVAAIERRAKLIAEHRVAIRANEAILSRSKTPKRKPAAPAPPKGSKGKKGDAAPLSLMFREDSEAGGSFVGNDDAFLLRESWLEQLQVFGIVHSYVFLSTFVTAVRRFAYTVVIPSHKHFTSFSTPMLVKSGALGDEGWRRLSWMQDNAFASDDETVVDSGSDGDFTTSIKSATAVFDSYIRGRDGAIVATSGSALATKPLLYIVLLLDTSAYFLAAWATWFAVVLPLIAMLLLGQALAPVIIVYHFTFKWLTVVWFRIFFWQHLFAPVFLTLGSNSNSNHSHEAADVVAASAHEATFSAASFVVRSYSSVISSALFSDDFGSATIPIAAFISISLAVTLIMTVPFAFLIKEISGTFHHMMQISTAPRQQQQTATAAAAAAAAAAAKARPNGPSSSSAQRVDRKVTVAGSDGKKKEISKRRKL